MLHGLFYELSERSCEPGHQQLVYSFRLKSDICATHHEINDTLHILRLCHDELELVDVGLREKICCEEHLGKLRLQIDTIAFLGNEIYITLALIEHLEETFYIIDIYKLHNKPPLFVLSFVLIDTS